MGYGLWAMGWELWASAANWYVGRQKYAALNSESYVFLSLPTMGERRVGDFKKLEVWQVAHKIVCEIYRETAGFPRAEAYGLTAQLRRSAASVPANLAEGCGRRGDTEFSRFVRISLGSATELEYHLILSRDVGLMPPSSFESLSANVLRMQGMLAGLHRALKGPRRSP